MILKLLEFLKGKKTYIASTGMALVSLSAFLNGEIDTAALTIHVLEAFGFASLRAGIAKAG